ncbi:GIY-YIG nuclease family protein [Azospirillum melinis]|uniref:GIY-YIG nuclease family protein n=1 Tax=Azospirillum melinis TaxID=328839 RepID=UPI00375668CA
MQDGSGGEPAFGAGTHAPDKFGRRSQHGGPNQFSRKLEAWFLEEPLFDAATVLGPACPVPRRPGVYAWFFRRLPPGVPATDVATRNGMTLLYVGIAPRAPPANGKPPSRQSVWSRVRYHYRGNAEGSTLRLTLGCLLAETLGIELRRVGSGNRLTFGPGEVILSAWMAENALVCWQEDPRPWEAEDALIRSVSLPLNLQGNQGHTLHGTLSRIRAVAKERARSLPIL